MAGQDQKPNQPPQQQAMPGTTDECGCSSTTASGAKGLQVP